MRIRYKKNRLLQFYESECLRTTAREPPAAIAGPHNRCVDCPYPGHGFICGNGEHCLRTEMARIMERDKNSEETRKIT